MKSTRQPLSALSKEKSPVATLVLVATEAQAKSPGKMLSPLPEPLRGRVQRILERQPEPLKAGQTLKVPGIDPRDPEILVGVAPADRAAFDLLGFARGCLKQALRVGDETLGLAVLDPELSELVHDCFGAAVAARVFALPAYGRKAKSAKPYKLREVRLYAESDAALRRFEHGFATGDGSNVVRFLGMLPPNDLSSRTYGNYIRRYAREHGLKVKFYSRQELKRMGAGAFTAVDQADPNSGGGIYELTYAPKKARNSAPVALVGKGMCFDTGGYDVKINSGMITMKGDMQGSAVALATLVTASRLKLPLQLKAYLVVTENHISPAGFKADEVVVALNGMSIEVVNTDAEGRMILADGLALASRGKPEMIIDFATLTGSAVRAIGTGYAAGFSNRDTLHAPMRQAGEDSGERVWPFPIVKSYAKALDSQVADIKQCVRAGSPDHIMAAYFLSQFVDSKIPWVHVDLAAAENEGGLAHVDTLFTGFGVRWAIRFLEDRFLG